MPKETHGPSLVRVKHDLVLEADAVGACDERSQALLLEGWKADIIVVRVQSYRVGRVVK